MEQRQSAEEGLPRRDAIAKELADAPRVGHLVRMRAHRDLGRAGGAAGTEVGRPVAGADHAAADEAVHRLPPQPLREVVHAEAPPCTARRRACDARVNQHDVFEAVNTAEQRLQPRPQIHAGNRSQGDQHLRFASGEQLDDGRGLQHGIDGKGDAGGLAAPHREMRLRQIGQHEGDDIVAADAQFVEEVGRGSDAGEQRLVGPDFRPRMVLDAQEERQRRRVGVGARRGADHLVGAVRQQTVVLPFESEHVCHGGNSAHAFTFL